MLNGASIPTRVSGGDTVFVSEKQLSSARVILAKEGLPRNGTVVGYEIFNKAEVLGSSSFYQNINLVRALEGELSRTVSSFADVRDARIHLVIPKKEIFLTHKQTASASIVLDLKPGVDIDKKEIYAISHLIASAVPELTVNDITIVDSKGKPYKLASKDDNYDFPMYIQEYKISIEKQIKDAVEGIGYRLVGPDSIVAEVSVDLETEYVLIDEESFDPDEQVLRSSQTLNENSSERIMEDDNVTVENNIPNANPDNAGGALVVNNRKTEELVNYDISRTMRKVERKPGNIRRISIGILIDGTYESNEEGVLVYQPRTQEFMDDLRTLIISAVGFDETRDDTIEIVNIQFDNRIMDVFNGEERRRGDMEYILTLVKWGIFFTMFVILVFVGKSILYHFFPSRILSTSPGDDDTQEQAENDESEKNTGDGNTVDESATNEDDQQTSGEGARDGIDSYKKKIQSQDSGAIAAVLKGLLTQSLKE
ncbi:MAG: flagellar M-ring protein FliF [Candidatus Xenolissoclinum pacificiensis L6]|uniref:Flagellar M-ring protein FliF n=1 Tax=Candidatus Xenolissoclinum pacificiensis L6 TaxID=1401685 RepID=W2V011_9RICK|nr:MAG: flagellar M-ring protein FliF [Candidatus Xenolissoclinum pacificiensis L6]